MTLKKKEILSSSTVEDTCNVYMKEEDVKNESRVQRICSEIIACSLLPRFPRHSIETMLSRFEQKA